MDAGPAAFLGAISGAVGAGVPPVVAAWIQRGTAKAQREHDKGEQDAQRQHDELTALRQACAQQDAVWRTGLAAAAVTNQQWESIYTNTAQWQRAEASGEFVPNIVGEAWFQSLRQHMASHQLHEATGLRCTDQLVVKFGNEIDRIEREWAEEANG